MYLFSSISLRYGLVALLFLNLTGAHEISNSHISPNSARKEHKKLLEVPLPAIIRSEPVEIYSSNQREEAFYHEPEHHNFHKRDIVDHFDSQVLYTKSADPIQRTNEDILTFSNFPDTIVDNDIELSGRDVRLIQPTKTLKDGPFKNVPKTDRENSGEGEGAPKTGRSLSEPQVKPTTVIKTTNFATLVVDTQKGRQASPDIQDIITGIVKLLNGNVNVQANTAPAMGRPLRPISTRINNRGPPRITDVPALPPDFDAGPLPPPPNGATQMVPPPSSTRMPTPYPFDIPPGNTSPVKPFLSGVPLPEQLVPGSFPGIRRPPSIPPWKRPPPQRRPPQRRPLPYNPYKPIPSHFQETLPTAEENLMNTNTSQDILNLNFGPDIQLIPITEEPDSDNQTELEMETTSQSVEPSSSTEGLLLPEKTYKDKDKEIPEKKKDKNSQKMEKHQSKYNIIVNTSSEVNEKTITSSTSNLLEATSTFSSIELKNDTISNGTISNGTLVDVVESMTSLEGIGEATPVLDPSMLEVVPSKLVNESSSSSSSSSSSVPTESLPSSAVLVSKEGVVEKTSILSSKPTKEEETGFSYFPYKPRPGIVLDDTEYKPGNRRPPAIITARPPIGQIGDIFDVTVSAIQGPGGSGSGSGKPFVYPVDLDGSNKADILTTPSGTEGFVSIDGKRTYLNLFGDDTPTIVPTRSSSITAQVSTSAPSTPQQRPTISATGYAVPHTTEGHNRIKPTNRRPGYTRRPSQPPVRIDTCIVGDPSTCDTTQNEICRTELGVSSCHCRPGHARRKHREPCRRVVQVLMSLRVDRLYDRRVVWSPELGNSNSEAYQQLAYETTRAVDSAMSMTPFSDEFMTAKINSVYAGERSQGQAGVFVNMTLQLEENSQTSSPAVRHDIQKHLLGVIQRRSNNVGNSALWVDSPPGSVSNLQDVDECSSSELHDCHSLARCINVFGGFECQCGEGYRDPWADNRHRAGRQCDQCPSQYCNNRGECRYQNGQQVCVCTGNYYGSQCEVDGEVLGVAVGASVAAVVIIVMTLVCLVMWSRRWSREQKAAGMGSPVFGYMATAGSTVKTPAMGGPPYQVSLEDRLRWAQIADAMAQANHYAQPEPGTVPTRPSSAVFGYPTLSHTGGGTLPPIPMPRLGLHLGAAAAGRAASVHGAQLMRPQDNSSSSEEEDRADLLGRNFHVPRPKSRSNASIANQSGIYYDVDYDQNDIYKHHQGGVGIPMSTYTPGRPPFFRN